jgi:predicted RNA-binding Zn-ribbon protein involved in translation (DUF1610 family)
MGLFDFFSGKKENKELNDKKNCPKCGFSLNSVRFFITGSVKNITCPNCGSDVTNIVKDSFTDIRDLKEIEICEIAKNTLNQNDEAIATRLILLLKKVDNGYNLLPDSKQEIKTIGKKLWEDGGMAHMWLVAYRVQHRNGDVRLLELAWDRIGDWLA